MFRAVLLAAAALLSLPVASEAALRVRETTSTRLAVCTSPRHDIAALASVNRSDTGSVEQDPRKLPTALTSCITHRVQGFVLHVTQTSSRLRIANRNRAASRAPPTC